MDWKLEMVCHLISKRFYELVNDKLTDELRGSIPLQATKIKIMTRGEQEFYRNIERIAKALEALVKIFNNGKK